MGHQAIWGKLQLGIWQGRFEEQRENTLHPDEAEPFKLLKLLLTSKTEERECVPRNSARLKCQNRHYPYGLPKETQPYHLGFNHIRSTVELT